MKKKVNVVMLPTGEKVQVNQIYKDEDRLKVSKEINRTFSGQNLYFTSDEEIKEGDNYYAVTFEACLVFICASDEEGIDLNEKFNARKIIASTDTKLTKCEGCDRNKGTENIYTCSCNAVMLPQIPQSFVEEYAKQGGIDEVELELELKPIPKDMPIDYEMLDETHHSNHRLKLTSNNEVIVNLIEEKMYSREEVMELLMTALFEPDHYSVSEAMGWIKENL